jgi:hypothetical protein
MTLYELLLFMHVAGSIVWIGAGFLSLVLATTYDRDSDEAAITRFLHDQDWLAMKFFGTCGSCSGLWATPPRS